MWEMTGPTTISNDYSFWIPSADFITTTAVLDDLYIRADTSGFLIKDDNVFGFSGSWKCTEGTLDGAAFKVTCSRYLPKPTSTNTYTGDFRFSPKMTVGNTNPSPPVYKAYIHEASNPNALSRISTTVTLKNAYSLMVTATISLTFATLF